jgi:hypothetical protein
LELEGPGTDVGSFSPGDSLQRILRLSLHEEGDHTLAVTVTYTETTVSAEGRAAGGKVRTFRKLYQFVAANLISVRTKSCDLEGGIHALEAQLENLGDYGVVLEVSLLNNLPRIRVQSHIGCENEPQTSFYSAFVKLGYAGFSKLSIG